MSSPKTRPSIEQGVPACVAESLSSNLRYTVVLNRWEISALLGNIGKSSRKSVPACIAESLSSNLRHIVFLNGWEISVLLGNFGKSSRKCLSVRINKQYWQIFPKTKKD